MSTASHVSLAEDSENVTEKPAMADDSGNASAVPDDPPLLAAAEVPQESKTDAGTQSEAAESIVDAGEAKAVPDAKECNETEVNDDARSLDLESLGPVDELVLGAAGSDSGVEGCGGRALSSGGGSRSCASSVVSCGSGCGSESSSLAGAPSTRPRRRLTVTVAEPQRRAPPPAASTPRPVTAPRGPNLATRERARSREKPAIPEKPRPLTPKPRIRPTVDLPNLVRESPALRAKPTKTSTARCRTPSSPSEDKRWPTNGARLSNVMDTSATRIAADKYGTLPRRKREEFDGGSPRHEAPPVPRRPATVTRSVSTRSATKTRVRIYAEKTCQTVLLGSDVESALAGLMPNIESHAEVTKCHRGVQASARDTETARLSAAVKLAEEAVAEERARRTRAEEQLAAERAARLAAHAELERNTERLLELAGAGAGGGADGCLRALEEQLCAARELAARQRAEADALRAHCDTLHAEACKSRESARSLEARLGAAEREAAEMQDFLAAETGALSDSLREAEAELAKANQDLDKRRAECRQLVRMCEQRRQEALAAVAKARGSGGAASALDALGRRLRALTEAVARAYRLPRDQLEPTVYHNDAYSRSDSGEALTPEDELPRGGLLAAVTKALRIAPAAPATPAAPAASSAPEDRSHISDDNDNSADLLDSETEPCLVTDPDYAEEWWSGAEAGGAWSGEELSPVRDEPDESSVSERESLRNLSAAIAHRQRSEAEDAERGSLLERVLAIDNRLTELLRALRLAAASSDDADSLRLANALRDRLEVTERGVADVVVKKLAELDASRHMMDTYRSSVEMLKKQLAQPGEEDNFDLLEQELISCSESERRERYEALDAALGALSGTRAVQNWQRLARLRDSLEKLAFALAAPPPPRHLLHTTA